MSIDLNKQCPGIVKAIPGIPNDAKGTALPELFEESRKNKAVLAKRLGLDDTYRIESIESVADLGKYPRCTQLFRSLCSEELSNQNILDNTTPSGAKLSRIICKVKPVNLSAMMSLPSLMHAAAKELSVSLTMKGLSGSSLADIVIDDRDGSSPVPISSDEDIKNSINTIVAKFWETISAETNSPIGFSLNFWDIINAANSPYFTSCFSFKNSNGMGPFQVARYPLSGVIYIRHPSGNIIGRCWVLFDRSLKYFVVLPRYGSLTAEAVHTVCKYLCKVLNPSGTWESSSKVKPTLEVSSCMSGWYADPIRGVYLDTSMKGTLKANFKVDMESRARCPICGSLSSTSSACDCACIGARFKTCTKCDKMYLVEGDSPVTLCPECRGSMTKCINCSNEISAEGPRNTLWDYLCDECKGKSQCAACGKSNSNGKVSPICPECTQILSAAGKCETCGVVAPLYPILGHGLCLCCFTEACSPGSYHNVRDNLAEMIRRHEREVENGKTS